MKNTRRAVRRMNAAHALRVPIVIASVVAIAALVMVTGAGHGFLTAAILPSLLIGTVVDDFVGGLQYPAGFYTGKPRIFPLGSQTFTLGGPDLRYKLEKNGYLDMILVRLWGTYTVATAPLVFLPRAPWNIIREFRLNPPGRQKFLRAGGWSLHEHDIMQRLIGPTTFGAKSNQMASAIDTNTGRSSLTEAFPVALGAQTFEMWIPIATRRSVLDARGRIPLHNDSDTILYLSPQTAAELFTTPANFTVPVLNADVWQVTYDEVPNVAGVKRHDTSYVVTYEEQEDVLAVGDNKVNIDPGGIILGICTALRLNEVLTTSDKPDYVNFKVDNVDITEPLIDPRPWFFMQKRGNDFLYPDGVFAWPFDTDADTDGALWRSLPVDPSTGQGVVGATKVQPSLGRMLDTTDVKQIKINYHLPAGTVLGATPRAYTTVRRLLKVSS